MSKSTLKISINGKDVGLVSDLEVDMPSFRARFQPASLFAEFAPLFVSLDRAYDERRYDAVDQLSHEINKLKICIKDERSQLLFSSDPSDSPVQRITTVRIRGGEIMWRPTP